MFIHNKKKRALLYLVNLFIELGRLPAKLIGSKRPEEFAPKKILVVRLDHIGDLVMTSPSFSLLREEFPNAEITLLASSAGKQLYGSDSRIDKVEVFNWPWKQQPAGPGFDGKKISELLSLVRKLRSEKFDLFLDFRGDLRFIFLFGVLTGCRMRLGNSRSGRSSLLDKISEYSVDEHEVERSVKVVRTITDKEIVLRPSLQLQDSDLSSLRQKIAEHTRILPSDRIAIIGPYSSRDVKSWPAAYFQEVISYLIQADLKVIVVGAPADRADSEQLIKGFSSDVYTFAGITSVRDLAALVSVSAMVVGVDTGVLHLASCFDVPIIALFGSTRAAEFRPYSPFARILDSGECTCNQFLHIKCDQPVEGYAKCLSSLKPATVIGAIKELAVLKEPALTGPAAVSA